MIQHIFFTLILLSLSSCSVFGIQDEEGPDYEVLKKSGPFEIRRYAPHIIAKVSVEGNYDESSGKAFRILAGYIFGDNSVEKEISMTSPVKVEENSQKISMTSPVKTSQNGQNLTMAFSMPAKYELNDLPRPNDKRITFEKISSKLIACHEFSWLSSSKKNKQKAEELREWVEKNKKYRARPGYSYAGYNPPWTLPPFRRNEVHIEVRIKK